MLTKKGKTNWVMLVAVAAVAGAAGGFLSSYINDSVRQEIELTNVPTVGVTENKISGAPVKKCGVGEGFDPSACNASCTADSDCQFVCGCGAINNNETCNTNGVTYDCIGGQVSCLAGICNVKDGVTGN